MTDVWSSRAWKFISVRAGHKTFSWLLDCAEKGWLWHEKVLKLQLFIIVDAVLSGWGTPSHSVLKSGPKVAPWSSAHALRALGSLENALPACLWNRFFFF